MIEVKKTDRLVFDLKLKPIDQNEEKRESLRKKIAKKYGVPLKNVEVNFVSVSVDENGKNVSLASDVISSIQDPKFQQALFKEYLEANEIKDVDINEIITIDEQVNDYVDFDSYSKYKSYKFKYAKWDNYLSYGKGNFFDFTKLNGLVLLNSQPGNQSGKTTFAIDLLRFALFGKSHKSPRLDKVFNTFHPEETEVMVEVCIEIDSSDYVIRRTITRPPLSKRTKKSKCKQKVEYFRLVDGNYELIDNCEGENNAETNNIIKESVGNVDDYNLVISATAGTLGKVFEMGQTDRGELFSRWLGLQTIEKKSEIAKDMWKKTVSPTLLYNKYNRQTLEDENNDFAVTIEDDNKKIAELQGKLNESSERINSMNDEKVSVLAQLREIKDGLDKIDIQTLQSKYNEKTDLLDTKRSVMRGHKEEYMPLKDIVFNEDDLKQHQSNVDELTEKKQILVVANGVIKSRIGTLKEEIKRVETLIEGGKCPTCGQDINVGEQNHHIEEIKGKIDTLIQSGINNKASIDSIDKQISEEQVEIKKQEEKRDAVRKRNELELIMTAVKSNIDTLKLQINDIARQMTEISTNEENIRHNNDVRLKVATIDSTIKTEQGIKENHIRAIEALKTEIKNYTEEIEKRKSVIEQLKKEEKIIRNWSIYQELVGKNGIVKIVLRRALPILNNEIARLLNGLCDFNVEVSIDENNAVCMDLVCDGQKLDVGMAASGFETVMASLAVRHALSCIATLSRPNFTVYDEVLGGVADYNHENVRTLFNRMAKSYDFILHITHNESLADWHNKVVTVSKNDDRVSVINIK